jgi:hypothetical protein
MLVAKTGTAATGDTRQRLIFRLKSRLPTASGCHFQEAETSERRRFWAALGRGNSLGRV